MTKKKSDPLKPQWYFSGVICGLEGSGKSHLALSIGTLDVPVYVLDTEYALKPIMAKHTGDFRYLNVEDYDDIVKALETIIELKEECVVIIDSGSDYGIFGEAKYKEIAEKTRIWPVTEWHHVHKLLNEPLLMLKKANIPFLMTGKMKPHYVNEKWDGETYVPRIFSNLRYMVDFVINLNGDDTYDVLKNRWRKKTKTDNNHKVDDMLSIVHHLQGDRQ